MKTETELGHLYSKWENLADFARTAGFEPLRDGDLRMGNALDICGLLCEYVRTHYSVGEWTPSGSNLPGREDYQSFRHNDVVYVHHLPYFVGRFFGVFPYDAHGIIQESSLWEANDYHGLSHMDIIKYVLSKIDDCQQQSADNLQKASVAT